MSQSTDFTNQPLSYEQVQELLPGFALGALDVHEMQAVERYLQQHEELIQHRYDLEVSMQAIAYSAAPQPLPTSIKSRLMERVHADQESVKPRTGTASVPVAEQRRSPFTSKAPAAAIPAGMISPVQLRNQRKGSLPIFPEKRKSNAMWQSVMQGAIGFAAVAATALLIYSNWQLQNQANVLNQQVAAIQQEFATSQQELAQNTNQLAAVQTQFEQSKSEVAQVQSQLQSVSRDASELRTTNETLQTTLQQQNQQINLLTTANRLLTLASLTPEQSGTGTFLISGNTVILSVRGLKPVPQDKTYQLWYIAEGEAPKPADLFQIQNGDSTVLTFTLPAQITSFASVGVSIEPEGGSQAPTDVVLLST